MTSRTMDCRRRWRSFYGRRVTILQSMDAMTEVASRTSDSDWNEHTQSSSVALRLSSRTGDSVGAGGSDRSTARSVSAIFGAAAAARESAHLTRGRYPSAQDFRNGPSRTSRTARSHRRVTLCFGLEVEELKLTWKDVLATCRSLVR